MGFNGGGGGGGSGSVAGVVLGYAEISTSETTPSAAYTDLATVGPSIAFTVPAGQSWDVLAEFWVDTGNAAAGTSLFAPSLDGAVPADADSGNTNVNGLASTPGAHKFAAIGPGAHTIKLMYRASAGTPAFRFRRLKLTRTA